MGGHFALWTMAEYLPLALLVYLLTKKQQRETGTAAAKRVPTYSTSKES